MVVGEFIDCDEVQSGNQISEEEKGTIISLLNLETWEDEPLIDGEWIHTIKEDSNQSTEGRAADCTLPGQSSMDSSCKCNKSSVYGTQWRDQVFKDVDLNNRSRSSEFLELQEANNIFRAAYKEIMTLASKANTWVFWTPALGSIEESLLMFRSPPPPGMTVECSIESAIVPIAPEILSSIMMNVDRWASSLAHIVRRGSDHVPTGVLQQLMSADENIKNMTMVNAEFQLPTPLVPTRKFCFLRCQRLVIPRIWAIVDVSIEYFQLTASDHMLEPNCRRRPSAVIIRPRDGNSEIIWIENVEVFKCHVQDNIYSNIVNSNLAFNAKRWVSTLIRKLKRSDSIFMNVKMRVDQRVHANLLELTECMEKIYLESVNETPNERKWVILSDQGVRILKGITENHVETLGLSNYIALTSFRVQAKPVSVFHFLVKKNMELLWPGKLNLQEPEEVIKFALENGSNSITLHRKVVPQNVPTKLHEYLLQEASRDEFCSLIISSPMSELDVQTALFYDNWTYDALKPSGFSIMPDGSGGLQSDASLVTIAMQQELDVPEIGQAIKAMSNLVSAIIVEINDAVAMGEKHQAKLWN